MLSGRVTSASWPAGDQDVHVSDHAAVQRPNVDSLAHLIPRQAVEEFLRRLHRSPIEIEHKVADDDASRLGRPAGGHANDQQPSLTALGSLRGWKMNRLNRDADESSRTTRRQYLGRCGPRDGSRDGDAKAADNRGGRDAGQLTGGVEDPTACEPLVHRRGDANDTRDFPPPAGPQRTADNRDDPALAVSA